MQHKKAPYLTNINAHPAAIGEHLKRYSFEAIHGPDQASKAQQLRLRQDRAAFQAARRRAARSGDTALSTR